MHLDNEQKRFFHIPYTIFISLSLVVVATCLILLALWLQPRQTSSLLYQSFSNLTHEFDDYMSDYTNPIAAIRKNSDAIEVISKLTFDFDRSMEMKSTSLNLNMIEDFKSLAKTYTLDVNYSKEDPVSFSGQLSLDGFFFQLGNQEEEQLYRLNFENFDIFPFLTSEDGAYLIKKVISRLSSIVKKQDIKEEKQILAIQGKKVKTKKITLSLSKDHLNQLYQNIISDFLTDQKSMEILVNHFKLSSDEMEEYKDKILFTSDFTYQVYVHDTSNIMYQVKYGEHVFTYQVYGDDTIIRYSEASDNKIDITLKGTKTMFEVSGHLFGMDLRGNYTKVDRRTNFNLKGTVICDSCIDKQTFSIKIVHDGHDVRPEKEYVSTGTFDFDVRLDETYGIDVIGSLKFNNKYQSSSFAELDVSDSFLYEDLSVESKEELSSYWENIPLLYHSISYLQNLPSFPYENDFFSEVEER